MDNSMMQMMMQMMMNQNQMMAMMMQQMNTPAPQQSTSTPTINFETNSQTNDLNSQLAAMRAEIDSLKAQLAEAKERATNEAQRANVAERELGMLKTDIRVVEKFYGKTIFEMAADVEPVSGDDYYGDHKEEWNEQGLTNEQKHEKVKEFRDAAIAFADNALEEDMIQF